MKIKWGPHPDHPYRTQIRLPNNYVDLGAGVSIYIKRKDTGGVHVFVNYKNANGHIEPLFQKNMFSSDLEAKRWVEFNVRQEIIAKMTQKQLKLSQEIELNQQVITYFL